MSDDGTIKIPPRIGDYLPDVFKQIDARGKAASTGKRLLLGLSTGFSNLDDMTLGIQKGELTIIAARPSMGKTALALNMASTQSGVGAKILFASIEMSAPLLLLRIFATEAQVDFRDLQTGHNWDKHCAAVTEVAGRIAKMQMYVDDVQLRIETICAIAHKMKRDVGLDAVYVDYLQLGHTAQRQASRELEVSHMSKMLKALSKEAHIPVVALAQLNREVERRSPPIPQLSDLRESGTIEQDADNVWMLYRPEWYAKQYDEQENNDESAGLCAVYIRKQRNGPTGKLALRFNGSTQTFQAWPDYQWKKKSV